MYPLHIFFHLSDVKSLSSKLLVIFGLHVNDTINDLKQKIEDLEIGVPKEAIKIICAPGRRALEAELIGNCLGTEKNGPLVYMVTSLRG